MAVGRIGEGAMEMPFPGGDVSWGTSGEARMMRTTARLRMVVSVVEVVGSSRMKSWILVIREKVEEKGMGSSSRSCRQVRNMGWFLHKGCRDGLQ